MKSIAQILEEKNLKQDPRNKYEFQAYGNRLAEILKDQEHRTLYIKLAKKEERELLESAMLFALASEKKQGLGRIFMWKLTELKKKR